MVRAKHSSKYWYEDQILWILLGVLVAIALVLLLLIWLKADPQEPTANEPPKRIKVTETITETVTVPPEELTAEEAARLIKPLVELEDGDEVLYDGTEERDLCEFREFVDGILDTAKIKCDGKAPQTVATALLTPIEMALPEE